MPSDLFQSFGHQQQNPRDAALSLLRQRGISIPDGISSNPEAIIKHLMQTGVVPQSRIGMAQQMIQRMFRR